MHVMIERYFLLKKTSEEAFSVALVIKHSVKIAGGKWKSLSLYSALMFILNSRKN